MFTSIENNTVQMMQNMQFNRNALFANTKLLKNELAAFIMSVIICYLVVEFISDLICTKIETKYKISHQCLLDDLNKRDDEVQALLIEICKLQEEMKALQEIKEATNKEATNKEATNKETETGNPYYQCDKCFNKYDSQDMADFCIIGNMLQHFCKECYETIDDDEDYETNDD